MRLPISRSLPFVLVAILALFPTVPPSHAEEATRVPRTVIHASEAPATASPFDDARPGSLAAAMQEILSASDEKLMELEAAIALATSFVEKLQLQQELTQTKFQTDIELLRVQAHFARERGDENLAQRIEADIDRLLNPPDLNNPEAQRASRGRKDLPGQEEGQP